METFGFGDTNIIVLHNTNINRYIAIKMPVQLWTNDTSYA